MKRGFACLCLPIVLLHAAFGQSTTPAAKFEVADVHVSAPGADASGGARVPGRFELRGVTMLRLIMTAYGVEEDRVIGGPSWLDVDRFDIIAKPLSSLSEATLQPMLQALLAERFNLAIRNEDRPLPVYALTLGKRNPRLKQAAAGDGDCKPALVDGQRTYTCHGVTMASLAERLPAAAPAYFDHPVVDRTGLTGAYDFTLQWTPRGRLGPEADDSVSLFEFLDKELGIKVEPSSRPAPVIVVEHVNQTPAVNPPGVAEALALPPAPLEFEVAAVHPSQSDSTEVIDLTGGRFRAIGMSLKELIAMAYGVDDEMVTGGGNWLDSDLFDVNAKTEPTASFAAMQAMLQALLAQRFKLAVRKEDRPQPVYALTLGARGPKLTEADGSARSGCKLSITDGVRNYICQNTTMAQLAEKLRSVARAYLDHPVVDLTGLKGSYDFTLSWSPAGRVYGAGGAGGGAGAGAAAAQPSGAAPESAAPSGALTVFEGIAKLGLKLAAERHPLPVLVVDHADRTPADN
ncbi:MAG: TIGR03435 family protein [Bryobacteraceae bacterium]